jgi:glycosyltransferase involved in cell wall biosynthesis
MRIAFVIYGDLETVSGGFIYDRALIGALGALGHQIDVVGLPWRGYFRALAGGRWSSVRRPRPHPSPPYDVVIHDELIHPTVVGQMDRSDARLPGGQPVVALVHNLACEQPGQRFPGLRARVERRYLSGVDGVIAVCQRTLAGVRALAGAAVPALVAYPGRDHITPAVDERLIDQRSAEPGPLRILHAAALTPEKGLGRLLAALAAASTRDAGFDFRLDVAGDMIRRPRHVRAIRRLVARLGLQARVHLHGELRGSALRDLFRRSHVLALPSDREAYSLACLEALGFGLPVLATSAGGLEEMIGHGREGFLIAPDELDAWSQALRRLAAERDTLRALGHAALQRYRRHATWREVALNAQQFLEALRRAPAGGAR